MSNISTGRLFYNQKSQRMSKLSWLFGVSGASVFLMGHSTDITRVFVHMVANNNGE